MKLRGMAKQHALAFAMGVNESTITRWKNNGPMSVDHVIRLCKALDISLDWFLNGVGGIDAPEPEPDKVGIGESSLLSCMKRAETAMTEQSRTLLVAFIESVLGETGTL
ncbi:helix-turn-helix transcriptional regulator [Rhodopseudomonas sp.]|uniref:helix-turn-helix domain-containing protein n=1 Tax=Rhodopseudomonas sp. TaxID=1078 RepID=UPI0025DB8F91|nr:helix-turn-helix transcriptional regulator [Rhodopseudomonas sp.]